MKTYVLSISEFFPQTHKKSGLATSFINSIKYKRKKHTIRGNYNLWKERFKKIESGDACLSVRCWTGQPYKSKQVEIFNFTNTHGISMEKLEFYKDKDGVPALKYPIINNIFEPSIDVIAENDGLSLTDFKEWFKKYDLSQPMAIIHFTDFKYAISEKKYK